MSRLGIEDTGTRPSVFEIRSWESVKGICTIPDPRTVSQRRVQQFAMPFEGSHLDLSGTQCRLIVPPGSLTQSGLPNSGKERR